MPGLDHILEYSESRRLTVCVIAGVLIAVIAVVDEKLTDAGIGFLYLFPILLAAPALKTWQILLMAALCGFLREAFEPMRFALGTWGRLAVATAGFAMTGFFVTSLNLRRRALSQYMVERERQISLRQDAEQQVRILIDTSPLAILTLDHSGRVALANKSAHELLGSAEQTLQGSEVTAFLPILDHILKSPDAADNLSTAVECTAKRRSGEVFLAHVWFSTYRTSQGPGLAAVVWDASENLRNREGSGLDSMMATSRVLIGALSHEIRNLASACAMAHAHLADECEVRGNAQYLVLGTLIQGLERIASSGLRVASNRGATVADLGTVLGEARIIIEPGLRDAGISLIWEVGEGLPRVEVDHHSLLQVFVNLARNSVQALEGCPVREMRISAALEGDFVAVHFRDSGPGVARPDELFRPFQEGARSAGLGLYISRAILHAHGGGLRYDPTGPGSCFTVELWPVEN